MLVHFVICVMAVVVTTNITRGGMTCLCDDVAFLLSSNFGRGVVRPDYFHVRSDLPSFQERRGLRAIEEISRALNKRLRHKDDWQRELTLILTNCAQGPWFG